MIGENGKKICEFDLYPSLIILFDSSSNIDDIKKFNDKDKIIITFDYESHNLLSKNGIPHEISDNYIDDVNRQTIQKNSYKLSKWFLEPTIRKYIEYEKINLGKLLDVEFSLFLIKFLKNFLEINAITKKFNNANYIVSPELFNIVYPNVIHVDRLNEKQIEFYYDKIKINTNIANITITIPYFYFKKLKGLSEIIIHFLFGLKKNSISQKNTLFVEFDVVRFQGLFSLFSKNSIIGVMYNRRKTSIWNFKSFSIIKKSLCKIATSHMLLDSNTKKFLQQEQLLVKLNFLSMLKHDEFFSTFFSICDISFWNIIKSIFVELFNKRFEEYVEEIIFAKSLLEKNHFSSIVVWSEIGLTEQIILTLAKSFKIPTTLIQHGLFYDTPEAYAMNKWQGVFPSMVDYYVVWGNLEKEHAIKYGVSPEKIKKLGHPQFDQIVNSSTDKNRRDFILIATSGSNPEEVRSLTVQTNEKYKETMKKICETVSKTNKKIIIKLHPSLDDLNIDELIKEINPAIIIIKTGDISSLIRSCDLMIVVDLTSAMIESFLCEKPTISISVKNWWGIPTIFSSNSCISTDVDNLENFLERILKNENFRNELIRNGQKFSNNYLSYHGNASQKLLDFLSNL